MFPKRYVTARPEDYPDLALPLWANPTGAHLAELFMPAYPDQAPRIAELDAALADTTLPADEHTKLKAAKAGAAERTQSSQRLGLALVASYDGAKATAYGVTFDFTTPAAAVATVTNEHIPEDLRYWLLNAPIQIPQVAIDAVGKTWASSYVPGSSLTRREA